MKEKIGMDALKTILPKTFNEYLLLFLGVFKDGIKLFLGISYFYLLKEKNITNLKLIFTVAVIGFIAIILASIMGFWEEKIKVVIEQKKLKNIQYEIIDDRNKKYFEDIEKESFGNWLTLVNSDSRQLSKGFTESMAPIIIGTLFFIVSLSVGMYISPLLSVIILFCSFLSYILPKIFSKDISKSYSNKMENLDNIQNLLVDFINKYELIRSYNFENKATKIFYKHYQKFVENRLQEAKYSNMLTAFSIGLGYTISTFWMIVGVYFIFKNQLTIGGFICFTMLSDYYNWPFFKLPSLLSNIYVYLSSLKRINDYTGEMNDEN